MKTNCLSEKKFLNLLFPVVRLGDTDAVAMFDTGAGMTLISRGLLQSLNYKAGDEIACGNNNGMVRKLETAIVTDVSIGDIYIGNLQAIVADEQDFDIKDDDGNPFPAQLLLGWDVISRFRWSYDKRDDSLTVEESEPANGRGTLEYSNFPIVCAEHERISFRAGIDTGHTESILASIWKERLATASHAAETVGIGSAESAVLPYAKEFSFIYHGKDFCIHDVDIFEKIHGAGDKTEALFGMDIFRGKSWTLDFPKKILDFYDFQ